MAEYIERGSIEYPYMSMSMWGINSATCKAYNEGVKATEDAIKAMHTADVVEVVRCKDCKHAYINSFSAQSGIAVCMFWSNRSDTKIIAVQHDDFCSYGAKMDGKGEGDV